MRDVFGPGTMLGYCTNVHAGATYFESLDALDQYALAVKQRVSPHHPMGIGWWLSRESVRGLSCDGFQGVARLRDWFEQHGLVPFTCNGFPFGDFHGPTVKHRVYEPSWSEGDRRDFTIELAHAMARLAHAGDERSISTLPVGWPSPPCRPVDEREAALNLLTVSQELAQIEQETGVLIHMDLEPEPGCILQRSTDVVRFFENMLLRLAPQRGVTEDILLRHLRVCHDVCHAAVMFEDQAEMFLNYQRAGIRIGKVQISSAVRALLSPMSPRSRAETFGELRAFAEDRYLHQTMIHEEAAAGGVQQRFYDDLTSALASESRGSIDCNPKQEWRVHFHVPVFLERFGLLETTQGFIRECFKLLRNMPGYEVTHWEVETYAWDVLPESLRPRDLTEETSLAAGIAREIQWVAALAAGEMRS